MTLKRNIPAPEGAETFHVSLPGQGPKPVPDRCANEVYGSYVLRRCQSRRIGCRSSCSRHGLADDATFALHYNTGQHDV